MVRYRTLTCCWVLCVLSQFNRHSCSVKIKWRHILTVRQLDVSMNFEQKGLLFCLMSSLQQMWKLFLFWPIICEKNVLVWRLRQLTGEWFEACCAHRCCSARAVLPGGLNLSVPGLAGEEVCCFSLQTLFVSVAVDLLWHSAKNSAIYTKGSVVEREIHEAALGVTQMWELSDRASE